MNIKIKRLTQTAKVPTRGSAAAAGVDLYADSDKDVIVRPGETVMIGTGIAMEIPDGYFAGLFARSGLASKQGLRPANCVGVIDSDYRGEIMIAVHNDSAIAQTIKGGERIAQCVIMPYLPVNMTMTDTLSNTERGAGGFGSTGA
jgi:dUTP pyrophosphatase